jgi:hypothetical protein
MKTKKNDETPVVVHTTPTPRPHHLTGEGTDPEMCCVCGNVFVKNEMHRTPDGLMCAEHWKESKYS